MHDSLTPVLVWAPTSKSLLEGALCGKQVCSLPHRGVLLNKYIYETIRI